MFEENSSWVMIAVVLAFALLGVAAIQTVVIPQQVEAAGCESSFPHSGGGAVGFNASKGRCFGH